jgi:hypothetical protein
MISTIIHSTEKEIVDKYFAQQAAGHIQSHRITEILANFGLNGAAPLPIRDMRGKKWQMKIEACSASLQIIMGGGSYKADLASTTIYRGDQYQMLMVVGSPDFDTALVVVENQLEVRDESI